MSSWPSPAGRSQELAEVGPVIDVSIVGRAGNAVPVLARGLIDTGSTVVFIDRRLALQAGLKAVDMQAVQVPGGLSVETTVYVGFLAVPALSYRERVRLHAATHRQVSHDVLLGRDFLRNFIVTFNGPEGTFHFFRPPSPSPYHPDDDFPT